LLRLKKLDNIPKYGPEEWNLAVVVERQLHAEATLKDMSSAIQQLKASHDGTTVVVEPSSSDHLAIQCMVADLQPQLLSFNASINARLDQLSSLSLVGSTST